MLEDLGKVIEERIKEVKASKKEIAKEAGVSCPTIYAITAGRNAIKLETAVRIFKALGMTLDDKIGLRDLSVERVGKNLMKARHEREEKMWERGRCEDEVEVVDI